MSQNVWYTLSLSHPLPEGMRVTSPRLNPNKVVEMLLGVVPIPGSGKAIPPPFWIVPLKSQLGSLLAALLEKLQVSPVAKSVNFYQLTPLCLFGLS